MFFDAERILAVRQMIVAEEETGRREALAKLLPMQRQDFVEIFRIMAGLPVTIRLLDPPLHEFLPHTEEEIAGVAEAAGVDAKYLGHRVKELAESNPMLGHRGCRLGISYPEIYEMQARAIFEAALEVSAEGGETVIPEVMIPLVATAKELEILKAKIAAVHGYRGSVGYFLLDPLRRQQAGVRSGQYAVVLPRRMRRRNDQRRSQ